MKMTVEEQLKAAQQYRHLWQALMPNIGTPDQSQFLYWAGKHTESLVVLGLNRAARKARKLIDSSEPMTLEAAIKYASSVMTNEMRGIHRFPEAA